MSNVIPFVDADAEALKTLDNTRNVIKFWSLMLLLAIMAAGVVAVTAKVGSLYDGVEVATPTDVTE